MEWLIIIMFTSLFFKDTAQEWLRKKMGLNGRNESRKPEDIPEWAKTLNDHYNEETTTILKEISSKIGDQCKKLDSVIRNQEAAERDDKEWRREAREFMRDLRNR